MDSDDAVRTELATESYEVWPAVFRITVTVLNPIEITLQDILKYFEGPAMWPRG